MKKIWRIHRLLSRCNCVQIGEASAVFVCGLPVLHDGLGWHIALTDMQNGFTERVSVATDRVEDAVVYHACADATSRLVASDTTRDAFVYFNALTAELPFGALFTDTNILPGGIRLPRKGAVRSAWKQAGPEYSWSKSQLFRLQSGDRVIFATQKRIAGAVTFTVAVLHRHEHCLVLRYPKPPEITLFLREQEALSAQWLTHQDIYNPHR